MTNRRNGLIVGLAVAVVGIAGVAIGVAAYLKRLPDPQTADRRGLFRWLVECDLRQQPVETKLVILQRMEGELLKGIDFREIASMLNDQQRRKLLENADLLANLWFRRQSDRYFGVAASDRSNLLGDQVAQIRRLGIMDLLSAIENWPAGSSSKSDTSRRSDSGIAGRRALVHGRSTQTHRAVACRSRSAQAPSAGRILRRLAQSNDLGRHRKRGHSSQLAASLTRIIHRTLTFTPI